MSVLTYAVGDFTFYPYRMAMNDLFHDNTLANCGTKNWPNYKGTPLYAKYQGQKTVPCDFDDWNRGAGVPANLFAFAFVNLSFCCMTMTLLYPCGVFAPTFTIGAALGRMIGEVLGEPLGIPADAMAGFAVAGAAAMTSGVTQSISPAIICLEVSREITLAIPVLTASIIAYAINYASIYSFYDSILYMENIPVLPTEPRCPIDDHELMARAHDELKATDVMDPIHDYPFIKVYATQEDIIEAMDHRNCGAYLPLVHNEAEMVLSERWILRTCGTTSSATTNLGTAHRCFTSAT